MGGANHDEATEAAAPGLTPEQESIVAEVGSETAAEAGGTKLTTYAASGTLDSEQMEIRLRGIEAKAPALEAIAGAANPVGGAEPETLAEIKLGLEQVTRTLQTLWAAVYELNAHSQDSLGFSAKETVDYPECGSHGTVSLPIVCTNCGHESEWGF